METTFILAFAVLWIVQIVFSQLQARHYRRTFNEMREGTDAGYMGVGVHKPRWGVGSVVILVTDRQKKILKAVHMTGVTVFSRFKPLTNLYGKPLPTLAESSENPLDKAILMAVQKIEEQYHREGDEQSVQTFRSPADTREQAV